VPLKKTTVYDLFSTEENFTTERHPYAMEASILNLRCKGDNSAYFALPVDAACTGI